LFDESYMADSLDLFAATHWQSVCLQAVTQVLLGYFGDGLGAGGGAAKPGAIAQPHRLGPPGSN
jgi:hypothetical protein